MRPDDVANAIELAYEDLTEDKSILREGRLTAQESAHLLELLNVTSSGDVPLVLNEDGRLVPRNYVASPDIYDDEQGARLIVKARAGDYVAKSVLYRLAADFVESGWAMPKRLGEYIGHRLKAEALNSRKRPGRDPYANRRRNFRIARTICEVVKLGFRPTRNRASQNKSACSIVAQALARGGIHLSESAVEKIWQRFSLTFSEELTKS